MTRPRARQGRLTGSLRFRVTALAALAVLAVLSAVGVGLTLSHRAALTHALDQSLGDRAEGLAGRLRAGDPPPPPTELPGDDVLVAVVAPDGTVLAASPALDGRSWPQAPRTTTVAAGRMPDGRAARVVAMPVDGSTVYVTGSLEDVLDSSRALLRSLLVAVPASTALLAGLVWLLVGRVLRPVEAIRAEVDRISASRLDRRVPEPSTSDEVARLAHTMNAMLDRLAGSAEQQRRFVADAAHELRSPLARVRAELEVDAAHPEAADLSATHASLVQEMVILQRLLDDLLLLARGDAGALDVTLAGPVDLDDVVEQQAAVRRRAGGPLVETRGVAPVQVPGDEAQLARAVGNLLDNAVRHARAAVTVTLASDDGCAVLSVTDDGPGLPPDTGDVVFERFTRLDEARSSRDGGAGLGLAIARDIAQRHGGTLTHETGATPGARFVLRLPLERTRP